MPHKTALFASGKMIEHGEPLTDPKVDIKQGTFFLAFRIAKSNQIDGDDSAMLLEGLQYRPEIPNRRRSGSDAMEHQGGKTIAALPIADAKTFNLGEISVHSALQSRSLRRGSEVYPKTRVVVRASCLNIYVVGDAPSDL